MTTHFTIPDRTLVKKGSKPGELSTLHLEAVRDHLAKLEKLQDPQDPQRMLKHLHVAFEDGQMTAQFLSQAGMDPEKMLVTDNGASQIAREVLPTRFFTGLKQLAKMDEFGAKLATATWAKFSGRADTVRVVRTVNMRVGGDVERVIRSCHSQGYAAYSNLEFVQDMLDHGGEYTKMPVLDWRVTDGGMRLRFAGCPGEQIDIEKPIPMVEGWNSEVGRRRVGLRGGMWKLVCTNGMGSWQENSEFNWIHTGNVTRIQNGVRGAFESLLTTASGVIEAYQEATNIDIDNAFAWMEKELANRVPDRVMRSSQAALSHPTTTPGGFLASVVDALTLVAQDEEDVFQQYEIERVAASLLNKGRGIALRNGGSIAMEKAA